MQIVELHSHSESPVKISDVLTMARQPLAKLWETVSLYFRAPGWGQNKIVEILEINELQQYGT